MSSTLATSFPRIKSRPSVVQLPTLNNPPKPSSVRLPKIPRACSSFTSNHPNEAYKNPITHNLKNLARTAILIGATASIAACHFSVFRARAETPPAALTEQAPLPAVDEQDDKVLDSSSPLSELLESNPEAVESFKSLLQEKLEGGQDEEALKVLERLVEAQPSESEWKFLMARLLNEMGRTRDAREVFEEILATNPLSFEALFENALLMDRCGEGEAVVRRLQEALDVAEEGNKAREARDVRLIMAQVKFLQKNVDEALSSYQELSNEDPSDFRPYFCRGMIYSLLDRNEEAKEQFAKYRELSPKKFEVEGYLRTPLSRMKLFGTKDDN